MATNHMMMGRRAFVGGTLATGALAALAACGKKGGSDAGSGAAGDAIINFYINNPVCIDPLQHAGVRGHAG